MAASVGIKTELPDRAPGSELRLLATNDLLGNVVPLPTTHGEGGTVYGVARLLEEERARGPALWLDSGDLCVGGASSLWGPVALEDIGPLPISAAAAGNHDFDDGPEALKANAARLGFPQLCADRDAGLPGTTLIDTPGGTLGVVGICHPSADDLAPALPLPADWRNRVLDHIRNLRREGARWVVALVHDGSTWWPDNAGNGLQARSDHLSTVVEPWASTVDIILGGHTLGAWRGTLQGVPAGHSHGFATSVLPVDLFGKPPKAMIHTPVRVPAVPPPRATPASAAIDAARQRVVGHLDHTWSSRPNAGLYLPSLVANAMRESTAAEAAFVPSSQLFTQAPIDGIVAALLAGPVTELDLHRLFPFPSDDIAVAELLPGEFRKLVEAHDNCTNPLNKESDTYWWNWARLPAGVSNTVADPSTVAIGGYFVPLIASWLGRDLTTHLVASNGRRALQEWLNQ